MTDLREIRNEIIRLALSKEPSPLFELAERLCNLAYQVQGGSSGDPDIRFEQQEARDRRTASAFEKLYCRIRDMADDLHREAIRRRDGLERGQFEVAMCDADKAIELTLHLAEDRMLDWDY